MFRNYLIVAFRNLIKYKVYSIVNIIGLSIGIAFFTLLFLVVRYELSYDDFHSKKDQIYRLIEFINKEGVGERSASVPFPFSTTLMTEYEDYVASSVRIFNQQTLHHTVVHKGNEHIEKGLYYVDSTFFDVFDYEFIHRTPNKVLSSSCSVVITDKIANKYFGDTNPIGQILTIDGYDNMVVTGVVSPPELPSHFKFDILVSLHTLEEISKNYGWITENEWFWNPCWTYIVLKEDKAPEELEAFFPDIIENRFPESIKDYVSIYLQPLNEIHLYSNLEYEISENGDIDYMYIFSGISILVLIIAGINFTSLSVARLSARMKRIGIRRSIGASRIEVMGLFMTETFVISLLAVFMAMILVELSLPAVRYFGDRQMTLLSINKGIVISCVLGSGLIVGIVSNIYPIYYLSSFRPAEMMSTKEILGKSSQSFRRVIVMLQLSITVFLCMGTNVNMEQLYYLMTAELGFETNNIVIVPLGELKYKGVYETFKKELERSEHIVSITGIDHLIGANYQTRSFIHEDSAFNISEFLIPRLVVRDNFLNTFDIKLVTGRNFSDEYKAAGNEIIINKSLAKLLGYKHPKDAIGQFLRTNYGNEVIIGVVKDFNFKSLHNEPGPLALYIEKGHKERKFSTEFVAVRIVEGSHRHIGKTIEKAWSKISVYKELNYFGLRKKINELYFKEVQLVRVSIFFSVIGIFIACLGLFGLSFFLMNQKRKEVAIRKALGATDIQIFFFLSKEFVPLTGISIILAWIASYFILDSWLDSFPFHINIGLTPFVISGATVIIITLMTVSFHTIKASIKHPANDLQRNT